MSSDVGKKRILFTAVQAALWAGIIVFCIIHKSSFTVSGIIGLAPESRLLAAAVMIALFALKSLSIVIYSGLLYIANGILFSLPTALLVDLIGTLVMLSLPYCIGKKFGNAAVKRIAEKYPKAKAVSQLRGDNDFIFSFVIKAVGILPADITSMYLGATGVSYKPYILGGTLGMSALAISSTVLGTSITDPHSPGFYISLGVQAILMTATLVFAFIYKKKFSKGNTDT